MKSPRIILSPLCLLVLMASCDPAKLIIFRNKSTAPVQVEWTGTVNWKMDKAKHEFRTVAFELGTTKKDRQTTIPFGFGNWPTSEIERFANEDVQSIKIESAREKIFLTGKKEIKAFLLKRRRGILRNFITITIR